MADIYNPDGKPPATVILRGIIEPGDMKHLFAIVFILLATAATAEVGAEQKLETSHLLDFVKNTPCKIIRNGKAYDGNRAVTHIQQKYDYFRNDIETTEQFIDLSATKSTMSGKYYTVVCGDAQPVRTKDWLLEELRHYRQRESTQGDQAKFWY